MAAVSSAPLDQAGKVALCGVIDDFVFGYVLRNMEMPPDKPLGDARAINELVGAHLATGQFPHIAAFVADQKPSVAFARAVAWMNDAARFEFGLQAILDAVAGGRTPAAVRARRGRRT